MESARRTSYISVDLTFFTSGVTTEAEALRRNIDWKLMAFFEEDWSVSAQAHLHDIVQYIITAFTGHVIIF